MQPILSSCRSLLFKELERHIIALCNLYCYLVFCSLYEENQYGSFVMNLAKYRGGSFKSFSTSKQDTKSTSLNKVLKKHEYITGQHLT